MEPIDVGALQLPNPVPLIQFQSTSTLGLRRIDIRASNETTRPRLL